MIAKCAEALALLGLVQSAVKAPLITIVHAEWPAASLARAEDKVPTTLQPVPRDGGQMARHESFNKRIKEAPWFYLFYFLMLAGAGAVSLATVIVAVPPSVRISGSTFVRTRSRSGRISSRRKDPAPTTSSAAPRTWTV